MPTIVLCSSVCRSKFVYVCSKTSNDHNFCSGYQNRANFVLIWDKIEFSLQCPL